MIEPRIYRAAFVPALLAIVVAMFSLESTPRPLPQGLAADVVFDGDQAATTMRELIAAAPDRRAGTPGDRAAAEFVRKRFEARGFAVESESETFESDGRELVNVIGRRAGETRSQIVVVAARDAAGVPDAMGTAASTAVLTEVARVFEGRPSRKTLVLASVDGSTLGELGTARLADSLDEAGEVDGVIAISGLGANGPARIVPWSNDTTRPELRLERTVAQSLREEQGTGGTGSSPAGQLARLAFPIGIGPQGVLLERGYEAVRLTGDGELGGPGSASAEQVDVAALERSGRALLRSLTALDQGPRPEASAQTYVTVVSQVMPGWVLRMLSLALILPALVASIDAFARARRRRVEVSAWLLWTGAAALPFVLGLVLARLLELFGATPDVPTAPVAPSLFGLDAPALVVLVALGLAVALAWLGVTRLTARGRPALADPAAPGAAVAAGLVLSLTLLVIWLINPYFALVMAPALHLWLLGLLIAPTPSSRVRVALVLGGLVAPALLGVYYLAALDLNPPEGAWYLLLLITGGHVSLLGALVGCVLAGLLVALISIVSARGEPPAESTPAVPSVRGPATYAGPGSLGGTGSALPRR